MTKKSHMKPPSPELGTLRALRKSPCAVHSAHREQGVICSVPAVPTSAGDRHRCVIAVCCMDMLDGASPSFTSCFQGPGGAGGLAGGLAGTDMPVLSEDSGECGPRAWAPLP